MTSFRFANTDWIHATWVVLIIVGLLVYFALRSRHILDMFMTPSLQTNLVQRPSLTRRLGAIALVGITMLALVLALMRPQWGMTVQHVARVGSQVMVCLDVSKSMLAEDVVPNRLERAKVELDALLGLMEEGQQVGLLAFAGKATVLCPMTTDFGFLRLVLKDTTPNSVGRGGTKIGEAISKAVDGFRIAGDMNRMILLITDGEDHDSFPLEAAKQAKEKGIKIVCIGFGDERGSKIEITDTETGMRSIVKDADGHEVVSRLDGELLRKVALATDGAFVPAGTGALDLESIYHKHIATLLAGTSARQQRVIHNEIYQWFVVAAICFLLMALLSTTSFSKHAGNRPMEIEPGKAHPQSTAGVIVVALVLSQIGLPAWAADPASQTITNKPSPPAAAKPAASPSKSTSGKISKQATARPAPTAAQTPDDLPPRTTYNRALAYLNRDLDQAEDLLNRARSNAGGDGELRFRTLYNLGWLEARRADSLLKEEPKTALQHLQQAANRFREAIRVRPDQTAARQNLEIISRRILALTDALNKRDTEDLAAELDRLLKQIREHQATLGDLVQRTTNAQDAAALEPFRGDYRQAAVTQRTQIADVAQFADSARAQLDAAKKKPQDKQTPKEKLKAVQIENMLTFIDRSLQRMNMSRSLARRMQGSRSFRRWSMALAEAKRARDQLRNPVEIIGQILADTTSLAAQTRAATIGPTLAPAADTAPTEAVPAWLTRDFLQEQQQSITARTEELAQLFERIVASQSAASSGKTGSSGNDTKAKDPETERQLANIRAALPLLKTAHERFTDADTSLQANALADANQHQMDGIKALADAWELFFDIRRLIEAIYRDEQLVQRAIDASAAQPDAALELGTAFKTIHDKNLARCDRLKDLLEFRRTQLKATASPTPAGPPAPGSKPPEDPQQAQRQRLQLALALLAGVRADMQQAVEVQQSLPQHLTTPKPETADDTTKAEPPESAAAQPQPPAVDAPKPKPQPTPPDMATIPEEPAPDAKHTPHEDADGNGTPGPKPPGPLAPLKPPVNAALEKLEQLRRLFFSLIEHLQDTARRQSDLKDDTVELSADPSDKLTAAKTGPLAQRQQELQATTNQIAAALRKQSEQAAAKPKQPPAGNADASGADQAAVLAQAADKVSAAESAMQESAQVLLHPAATNGSDEHPLAPAAAKQNDALKNLLEALRLLSPDSKKNNQQQNQQNQQQQQQDKQQQENKKDQQQRQNLSAAQLLQLIRDREAQRRKDRKNTHASSEPVDKDW